MPDVRGGGEVQVRGRRNATPPVLADQDTSELQLDNSANLMVVLQGLSTVYSYLQGVSKDDGTVLAAAFRKVGTEASLLTHDKSVRDSLDELLFTVKKGLDDLLQQDDDSPSQGALTYRAISGASNNADLISSGLSNINGYYLFNTSVSLKFVRFYNLNRAPNVGTDKPTITIPVPPGGAANVLDGLGIYFSQGIGVSITGAAGDTDNTNTAAGDVILNCFYSNPGDTSGAFTYRVISLATTNADMIKGSSGSMLGYYLYNTTSSPKFVKLYNMNRVPNVGVDKPMITIPLSATGGANILDEAGVYFSQGIAIAITGAYADSDTTALAAGDVIANIFYT